MSEGSIELDTIAEISMALIGFSALLAMFRGGRIQDWHPRARLAFWIILGYGFATLAFAFLPSALRDLGVLSWSAPMLILAVSHIVGFGLCLRRHFAITAAGHPTPNRIPWFLAAAVASATVVILLYGVAGGFGGPSYRLYHLGVLSCLFLGAQPFLAVFSLDRPAA